MDKKIKVGIIGCGGIATWTHVPGYKAIPDMAEVYALCDIDEAKLRKKGEEWGVPVERQFTDYKELIKSGIVDCVDICTPNHVHCEIAHAAIDAGLPFSIEKPIGLSYDEALKLSEAVEKSGVPSFVCFSWRYREYTRYVRDIIKSGKLGKIYHIYVKCIKDSGLWEGRKLEWRFDKDDSSKECEGILNSICLNMDGSSKELKMHYEDMKVKNYPGEIVHNFNGHSYRILEKIADKNYVLLDLNSGCFAVAIGLNTYKRYPSGEVATSENSVVGVSWDHGVYLPSIPSTIDFKLLKENYGEQKREEEIDEKKEFDIEIKEILSRVERVEADCLGDAIDKAMEMYYAEEIVLDADDFKSVDFNRYTNEEKKR